MCLEPDGLTEGLSSKASAAAHLADRRRRRRPGDVGDNPRRRYEATPHAGTHRANYAYAEERAKEGVRFVDGVADATQRLSAEDLRRLVDD
jgi:hypothetical protein